MKKNKKKLLEIPLDLGRNFFNFKKLINIHSSAGYIVHDQSLLEWHFSGSRYKDGQPYLYGPFAKGLWLKETLSLPLKKALTFLKKLIKAYKYLYEKSEVFFEIQLDTIFFLDNGDILFLPPNIIKKLRELSNEEYCLQNYTLINNPYLENHGKKLSYSFGALFYRIITTSFPYTGINQEEIHSKLRNSKILPASLAIPELKPEIVSLFDSFFNKKNIITPGKWLDIVDYYIKEGIYRKISKEDKAEILTKAQKQKQAAYKKYRIRTFIEKQGQKVIFSVLGIGLLFFFTVLYLTHIFKPRVTKGFSAYQVVEAFYLSINRLDFETIRDCVVDGAGDSEINETTFLSVSSKQELAYTGRESRVAADIWEKQGKPELNPPRYVGENYIPGHYVYGIINLSITKEKEATEPVFLAEFEKWQFVERDNQSSENTPAKTAPYFIRERLYLKKDGEDWVIYKKERLSEEAL